MRRVAPARLSTATLVVPLALALVATLFASPEASAGDAQQTIAFSIDPVAASGVTGSGSLTAADGSTIVTLEVAGLIPNASARATLHGGTCAEPSASFTELPALRTDAQGRATAMGPVQFRGEDLPIETLADGERIVVISVDDQTAACGAIPHLDVTGAPTAPGPEASFMYVVQPGDTLFLLARRFGSTVQALVRANPEITNPNLIYVGQTLRIVLPGGVT